MEASRRCYGMASVGVGERSPCPWFHQPGSKRPQIENMSVYIRTLQAQVSWMCLFWESCWCPRTCTLKKPQKLGMLAKVLTLTGSHGSWWKHVAELWAHSADAEGSRLQNRGAEV